MGNKSFTLQIKTKEDYLNYYTAMLSIADVMEVDPLLNLHGAIKYRGKLHLLASVNCSADTAISTVVELCRSYNLKGSAKELDLYELEITDQGCKIIGAKYYTSEDDFWNDLK